MTLQARRPDGARQEEFGRLFVAGRNCPTRFERVVRYRRLVQETVESGDVAAAGSAGSDEVIEFAPAVNAGQVKFEKGFAVLPVHAILHT